MNSRVMPNATLVDLLEYNRGVYQAVEAQVAMPV
jgi:hypothetical protein